MQAIVGLSAVVPGTVRVSSSSRPAARRSIVVAMGSGARRTIRACAGAGLTPAAAEVDYSSSVSVFPMEACELVGGEACEAPEMYPETKLSAQDSSSSSGSSPAVAGTSVVEREYLSYDDPKTVFPGEACDDLGGEFCEAPYQTGVSKE
ncbi:light-regulated protein, chloroplastic [Brachypodium distachyon]|uniref:Uncharacterized protein n=1 Tax=Brachypodium distachyon TaxID=15368 RepID=I1HC57_BRADI|nr:light-regulated protein, chloroplastic [Brachypodium distachyon]KQK02774.1 hypothetical protein BRADI_2g03610v3 [Brachypodium distachyon]|eukprot:XP_014754487.1 light-regulated protein, chloroplastic [Brachypodium distachyon]